ncbi:MAG TPA: phosphatase PAP2 family protein [Clostridia bacterium]|nr:phosphatase PAP2 family protein [Clostridia bacterium]
MQNKDKENSSKINHRPVHKIKAKCLRTAEWFRRISIVYWIIGLSILLTLALVFMPSYLWEHFWIRLKAQKHLITLVLVFCLVGVSLVWKTGQSIDVWAFKVFNLHGLHTRWMDWTMLGITQIGSGIFAMGLAVIFFLKVNHLLAYEIVIGSLSLWLVVEFLKVVICRTRPYIKLADARIVGSRAGGHSFPSGHTSQIFFLAALISHYHQFNLSGWLILYGVALLVGVTRIYVGMHYPRDVMGGAALGTAWGLFGVIVNSYI